MAAAILRQASRLTPYPGDEVQPASEGSASCFFVWTSQCQQYLAEGSHRRLYTFSPADYKEIGSIWGNSEMALPGDPPGELMVVDGLGEGGKIQQLAGVPSAFTPDYAPEEMLEIATKLYQASR